MARGPLRIATGMVLRPPVPRPPIGSLDFALQGFPGGSKGFMETARLATHLDTRLKRIVGTWEALSPRRRAHTWLEDLCRDVGIDPGEFLALVTRALYDFNRSISGILTAEALPEVTSAGIARACTPRGLADRRMFLRPLFDPACRPFASSAGPREAATPTSEEASIASTSECPPLFPSRVLPTPAIKKKFTN